MFSLYIHIPFCRHKCAYCSFFVLPEDEATLQSDTIEQHKERYFQTLKGEIKQRKETFPTQQLKTLYIGGGTPYQLGSQRIIELIDYTLSVWGQTDLEELTIELNPDPIDEVLTFVQETGKHWEHLFRVRYSFGIQTLDDDMLSQTGRGYTYEDITNFLRSLRLTKQHHQDFNVDLIAFGQGEMEGTLPRDEEKRKFFQAFVRSHLADHFSIYTLELFPGSQRYYQQTQQLPTGDPEQIMNEFDWYLRTLTSNGYKRYELSNFATGGHASIHNMVYWTGSSYLGCGINASSYINQATRESAIHEKLPVELQNQRTEETTGIRFSNTHNRKDYRQQTLIHTSSIEAIDHQEQLYEQLMMGLRLSHGVKNIATYAPILVENYHEQLQELSEAGYIDFQDDTVRLTTSGKAVYNAILTQLTA